ncbi:MAG: hypothetical protein DLM55_05450 [Acidimicrobiales bacterium]|nr:MAG: hypothetical protein DLM55_05450 [Acidimicrobiales bacterium]
MFVDICSLLIVGAVIGALARLVVPGYQPVGLLFTVLLGILGTIGGNFIAQEAHLHSVGRWALAVGISAVLVAIVAAMMRRGSHRNHHLPR